MRLLKLISIVAALLILSLATVSAQNWNVEQVSSFYSFWGSCQDVAVQGNFAYLANYSSGLCVVDISDPTAPVARGDLDFNNSIIRLSVQGNYACLAGLFFGFIMVDISNPDLPVDISSRPVSGIQDVTLSGQYLYVTSSSQGLSIFDISQPSSPTLAGHLHLPQNAPRAIAISGAYAYIVIADLGLFIIDVSNPAAPLLCGFTRIENDFADIKYEDGFVYVLGGEVYIVDVAIPESPHLIGQIDLGNGFGLSKSGQYVYVAGGLAGFHTINVSNPHRPVLISTYNTPGYAYGVSVVGDLLCLADGYSFRTFQVNNPQMPQQIANLDSSGYLRAAAKDGNLIYLGDYDNGLRIVDAADPAAPVEISQYFSPLAMHVMNLALTDSLAYLACHDSGMTIINISNPYFPTLVSNYNPPGNVEDVEIVGNLAYLANYNYGLRIMDVSDPYNPVSVGRCHTWDWAKAVTVSGNFAYVGEWGTTEIVNISDPTHPHIIGNTGYFTGVTNAVEVQGNYLFQVASELILKIVDVSDPYHPREVYEKEGSSYSQSASDIALQSNFAFLSTNFAGLQILNISDPRRPVIAGYHQLTNSSIGLVVDGVYAYLSDVYHFEVFDCSQAIGPSIDIAGGAQRAVCGAHDGSLVAAPNPFNPTTVFSYQLPAAGHVNLRIYDTAGRLVATPVDGWRNAGKYEATFDGSGLPSGIYLARFQAGDFEAVQKLVLMK